MLNLSRVGVSAGPGLVPARPTMWVTYQKVGVTRPVPEITEMLAG